MRPRDILAANINALIDSHPTFGSPPVLVEASGIPNGTLGRIRTAQVATTVDKLEGLATAFKVEPWELLVPPPQREAIHALMAAMKAMGKQEQVEQRSQPRQVLPAEDHKAITASLLGRAQESARHAAAVPASALAPTAARTRKKRAPKPKRKL